MAGDYIDDGGSGAFHITPPAALDRLYPLLSALRPTHRAALERLLATLDEIQAVTRPVPPGSGVDTAIDRAHLDRALLDLIRLASRLRQEEGRLEDAS